MKKIKALLIITALAALAGANTFAASGSLSVSTGSVYVGDSFTVSVNTSGVAAWNVHVTANGPVSNCVINQADATADANNTNKTFSAQCTATGKGTITLTLTGDVTSADGNNVGLSGTRTVTATEKPAPAPTQQTPTTQQKPATQQTPSSRAQTPTTTETPTQETPKSNNSSLKELTVDGYELKKEGDKKYSLSVPYITEEITINAAAEDEKTTIKGSGAHKLEEGENTITITATAEDGTKSIYTITIAREERCPASAAPVQDKNNDGLNIGLLIAFIASLAINLALVIALIILLTKNKKSKNNKTSLPENDPFLSDGENHIPSAPYSGEPTTGIYSA